MVVDDSGYLSGINQQAVSTGVRMLVSDGNGYPGYVRHLDMGFAQEELYLIYSDDG